MAQHNRLHVRELRRNLKLHLSSGDTVAIGDDYQLRALMVSIPHHNRYSKAEKRKAFAAVKRSVAAALRAESDV